MVVANDRFKECFHIPLFVDLVVSTVFDNKNYSNSTN